MPNIIVAFYKGRKKENPDTSFFDRLICFVTRSPHSHVELVYYYIPETNIGYCWSSSPRDGGVRMAVIHFDPVHWDLFEYTGPAPKHLGDGGMQAIDAWFRPKNGMKYDWIGAVATVIRFIKQIETKYFCSEIVAEFFEFLKPHLFTPKKLFKKLSPYLKRIKTIEEK